MIAIIQPHNIKAHNEAVEGFLKYLGRHLKQDFRTSIYESPQGLYSVLNKDKSLQIDLILTVGAEATAEVSQTIFDIPIVFTMVLDPDKILQQRPDIGGASINIPLDYQLNLIKAMLPNAKTVGVIYDPVRNADFVANSIEVAKRLGLQIQAFPVNSQKEVPEALDDVIEKTDVLWGIADYTVYNSRTTESILRNTLKARLPFIGSSELYVKAGALCSLAFSNEEIGRQAAELAIRRLSSESRLLKTPESTTPANIQLVINLQTAEIIGVDIPKNLREQASIVYE